MPFTSRQSLFLCAPQLLTRKMRGSWGGASGERGEMQVDTCCPLPQGKRIPGGFLQMYGFVKGDLENYLAERVPRTKGSRETRIACYLMSLNPKMKMLSLYAVLPLYGHLFP